MDWVLRSVTNSRDPSGQEKGHIMGYGFGGLLLVIGLVLALAVNDSVKGIDLVMVGWIMAAVGLVMIVLTALTLNRGGRARSSATTVHPDGSQTVQERRTDIG